MSILPFLKIPAITVVPKNANRYNEESDRPRPGNKVLKNGIARLDFEESDHGRKEKMTVKEKSYANL